MTLHRDPRGRIVYFGQQQWEAHTVRRHPELARKEWVARQTIEHPDCITTDADYPGRLCYYRRGIDPDLNPLHSVKVVVEFSEDADDGTFVTAFYATKIKPGEAILWRCQ